MSATTPARRPVVRFDETITAEPVYEETTRHRAYRFVLAATRLSLGWVFLWAFLDKTFGLGRGTPAENATSTRASRATRGPTGCSCSAWPVSASPWCSG
jgi:hypothetical protein